MRIVHNASYLLLIFCITTTYLNANNDNGWRAYLQNLVEEGMSEEYIDNMYQDIVMLENNPMNLNSVSMEQLNRFPLLSYEQAISLHNFLEKNRPIYTVYEIRNVPLFDFNTVELILPFFYVGDMEQKKKSIGEILSNGRNEILIRYDKTLNSRTGYGNFSDSILNKYPNRKYKGEDFYTSLKYSFTYKDKIQFGLTAEKDAGEPFFKKEYSKGYDSYGFHVIVRDIGNLKTVAIGDYRLSFGQGLILNNDFVLSKSWASNNIIRRTQEPKRHFSTAENGFLRGIAAVYQFNKVNVTAFYSNKAFDANISSEGNITSFKTDGYHRTKSDIEKKNNTREQVVGANINWRHKSLQLGVSGLYHRYNRELNPTYKDYNMFYLRGFDNYNLSVDYSYHFRNISLAGETALSSNGSIATLNVAQYKPSYLFSMSLLHRFLPVSYNAMHSKAFTDGSRVQNENGVYLGTSFNPLKKTSVTAYVDVFRFPWLKYLVDAPSKGVDIYLLAGYKITNNSDIEIRYKYKQKEQNTDSPYGGKEVVPYSTQKIRFRYNHELQCGLSFRTSIDFATYEKKYNDRESGFMISQNIGYKKSNVVQGDMFVGYFKSDSYSARLYSYEKNVLPTFYMPSFYGEGIRAALSGRYYLNRKLTISVKLGYSKYFDRDSIGQGTEFIDNNYRLDLYTALKWIF